MKNNPKNMDKLFKTIDAIARPASQPTPYSNGNIMAIRQSGRLMNYAKPFPFFHFDALLKILHFYVFILFS